MSKSKTTVEETPTTITGTVSAGTFASRRRERDEALRTEARQRYNILVGTLATGELTESEAAELDAAMEVLNITTDQLESDVSAVRRACELQEAIADLPAAQKEAADAKTAAATFETHYAAELARLNGERAEKLAKADASNFRLREIVSARAERGQLQRERYELFGTATPERHRRRRHLVQTAIEGPPHGDRLTYDVVDFENIMAVPGMFNADWTFEPIAGQSEAELANLVERAKTMKKAHAAGQILAGR